MLTGQPSYLIIGFGGKGVGDLLVATSFIRNLAQNAPGCAIDFAAFSPLGRELLQHNPYLRHVHVLDMEYVKFGGRHSLAEKARYLAGFRRQRYDTIYVLSTKLRHALFAFLCGGRERVGYNNYHRGFLLTKTGTEPLEKNLVERFLDLLVLDGKQVFDPHIELFLSEREDTSACQALAEAGVANGERLLALAPFAADLRRTWGLERFWQVAAHFSRLGYRVVVLGAAGERAHLDAHPLPPEIGVVDLVGKLGILETAAVIQRCAAFLGNDSGLGHVAGGVGTKALILGYFITRVWYPLAPSVTTLIKDTGCRSCNLDTCLADGGTLPPCFDAISVDEVIGALTGMLDVERTKS